MLIYDYILYNGEPIIEFRLKYLNNYVDKFIIVESIYTHSGNKKDAFYFDINKDIFKEYENKIMFYPINYLPNEEEIATIYKNRVLPENKISWVYEIYQRDYIQTELNKIKNPFIVFVCDVDEIPRKELYINIKNEYNKLNDGLHIEMMFFYYGFKWMNNNKWRHPFVINNIGCNKLSFSNTRLSHSYSDCNNAGWHFSNCLKIDDIVRKLESFAHTEYNTDKYKNKEYILKCINEGKSIFDEEQYNEANEKLLPDGYKEFQEKLNS